MAVRFISVTWLWTCNLPIRVGHVKSLTSFMQQVLDDMGTWCRTSTSRDLKTVTARLEHEGLSFLTITLADFGKDLQKALDQGSVGHDQFAGFQRTGSLPRFLGGFFDQVFDRKSGRLLPDPSVTCIQALRQFTLMWAKMSLPCTPAREKAAIEGYVECERQIREADATIDQNLVDRYTRIGRLLWSDVFSSVDKQIFDGDIIPRHSSGATADRLRGNAKWGQQEWTRRLERVFPHGEHLAPSWRYFQDLAGVVLHEPGTERPVRVITVPKTLKTPRIIAIEPTCMQYMQQGLLASITEAVEADDICSALIGWSSQVPNNTLAREGSRNGTLATLDLSEASDRVSNQHVRRLLQNHPNLAEGIDSCRSRKADVPDHGVIRLAKFASMGSALTFPIEAMVFATIIFVGIEDALNRPISRKDVRSLLGSVRVYGDDIIVPVDYVLPVISRLEDFGLRVNKNKSFWTGKFRESCGKDYYDGVDVSIVRVRTSFPADRKDVREIVSTVSLRNQLYKLSYWRSARYIDDYFEGLKIPLPVVAETSPVLGRHSFLGYQPSRKICPDLQIPLVKGLMVRSTIPDSHLEGYPALLKCLTKRSDLPFADVKHLERSGRPRVVDTKLGWGPLY